MKRFILGLLALIVIWIAGLAPQFLAYAHVSVVIIIALEGGISIAGYVFCVRLPLQRKSQRSDALHFGHVRFRSAAEPSFQPVLRFGLAWHRTWLGFSRCRRSCFEHS